MAFDEEELPWLNEDEPLRSEPRGFTPEQMIVCDVCLRANPPTRAACLYCAATLPATEASLSLRQPTLRRLEKWERGFNCILARAPLTASLSEEVILAVAQLLRFDRESVKKIVEGRQPLPLARVVTLDDANLIKERLIAHGFEVWIIGDEALAVESSPPVRLRALEFTDAELIAYPTGGGQEQRASWSQVFLLVTGRLIMRRVEVQERRGRGGAEHEIVDAREFGDDEALLDIYVARGQEQWNNWRIGSNNFDFSCLGAEKDLLAAKNYVALIIALQKKASAAKLEESYNRVRQLLTDAWPLEQRTEAGGWHRARPGKYSTESVTISDNERQFTLYSRLQHYLQTHKHAPEQ